MSDKRSRLQTSRFSATRLSISTLVFSRINLLLSDLRMSDRVRWSPNVYFNDGETAVIAKPDLSNSSSVSIFFGEFFV